MPEHAGLVIVPARFARAVRVAADRTVEVVNTHGTQVADTWAFASSDPTEFMSMAQSRSVNSRLWPRPGQAFVSARRRAMLTLLRDTSPGVHDTLLCACNAAIYAELGCLGSHRSCEDNLHEALRAEGISLGVTPAPLNLFMNVAVGPDGEIRRAAPVSRAGDLVAFRAEIDLLLVVSACPQDITIINSEERTPRDLALRVV